VSDPRFLGAVRGELRAELGDAAGGLALGGPAVFTTALNDWSQRRSTMLSGLVVLVGVLLLWWVVRDRLSVAASAVAIVGSQVMLVGMICRLGIRVDMVLSMVWPLMMALGFSFAAHRSLRRGVSGTLVLCGLTTAGGIVGFAFCRFPPIRSFALWGSVGLMLTWASVMLLVRPASRVGCCGQPVGHVGFRWLRALQRGAYAWSFGRPGVVVTAGVALTVVGLVCLPLLKIQNAPIRYFPGIRGCTGITGG